MCGLEQHLERGSPQHRHRKPLLYTSITSENNPQGSRSERATAPCSQQTVSNFSCETTCKPTVCLSVLCCTCTVFCWLIVFQRCNIGGTTYKYKVKGVCTYATRTAQRIMIPKCEREVLATQDYNNDSEKKNALESSTCIRYCEVI